MNRLSDDDDATKMITGENLSVGGSIPSPRTNIPTIMTPDWLANDMVCLANLRAGHFVLEPSAGLGALALAANKITTQVHCVELNADYCEHLSERMTYGPHHVIHGDFLRMTPQSLMKGGAPLGFFNSVLMNPPPHDDRYIDHVRHATEFLLPSGRLVALIVDRFITGNTEKEIEFREWVIHNGRLYKIEWPNFVINGISVGATLLVYDRP